MGNRGSRKVGKAAEATQNAMTHDDIGFDGATIYSTDRAVVILLVLAGMALQWASLHSITFADTVFGMEEPVGSTSAWVVNSVGTFTVFLILFIVSKRVSSLLDRRYTVTIMAACLAGGMMGILVGKFIFPLDGLVYAGNALIACGTTPLIIVWGEMYTFLNPKGEQLFVTLGAIILSVVIYLVEIHLPQGLAVALFVLLPLGSIFCLRKSHVLLRDSSSSWGARSKAPMERSPALFFVCIAVFSIPYNYLRDGVEMQAVLANVGEWSNVLAIAIVLMVAVALAEQVAERTGLLLVPSFVLFLLSAAMVIHLFFDGAPPLTVPSFMYAGYYLFLAMVYLALGPLVATTDVNPIRLFSGAMLANVGGLLFGSFLGSLGGWVGEQTAALAVIAITYVIFLAGCLLLYNRSYSIFRVNYFDESKYSFEYLVPLDAVGAFGKSPTDEAADHGDEATRSMLEVITAQCDVARDAYGLSAREHEVLIALTRGKTIASIAEALFVSENTAKAHTKAIYRKLGVHTREELLSCVENLLQPEKLQVG